MTKAPVLRSSALQKVLALPPARKAPMLATTDFAATLSKAQGAYHAPMQPATTPRIATSAPASAQTISGDVPFKDLIDQTAKRHGIDPALLAGLVKAESNFNPNAQSGVGARGLTQLMPATARGLGVSDMSDPGQSLEGGAKFLSGLLKQFHGDESLALAAYNAGPGAVQKFGGIPPYEETQRYVPKVLGYTTQFRRIWASSNRTPNA